MASIVETNGQLESPPAKCFADEEIDVDEAEAEIVNGPGSGVLILLHLM